MLFPFLDELNAAFREDRKLIWKLLGGAAVGLALAFEVCMPRPNDPQSLSLFARVFVVVGTVSASLFAVLALSLRDVVKARISDGQPVNIVLRWYLGSGVLSLGLWIVTAILGTVVAAIAWASWLQ
jgi:hypothetical protein